MKALLVVPVILMLGCQAPRFDRINMGDTKEQLRAALGVPESISMQKSTEVWNFTTTDPYTWLPIYWAVRFVDGKVDTFGRSGDWMGRSGEFDLGKDPNQKVIIDKTDKITMESVTKFDLATELAKLDKLKKDGLITAEDYEVLKKRAIEKAKE